jgi:hypothetical protein
LYKKLYMVYSFLYTIIEGTRALLCSSSLKLGGVGTFDSEDRRIFSDLSQMSTILEHGFYVRASCTSKELPT